MAPPTASVSVVIPVKGHPVLLNDAIASVRREMEAGPTITRLIVVDDGCDYVETRTTLAAWQTLLGARMMVLHHANGGLSAARNRGIEAALRLDPALDAIFLLDSDNMLAEGAGQAMAQLLQAARFGQYAGRGRGSGDGAAASGLSRRGLVLSRIRLFRAAGALHHRAAL